MHIDRERIEQRLIELKRTANIRNAAQPDLVLGCFYALNRENTWACQRCRYYKPTCRAYLLPFRIEEDALQLHKNRIYEEMTRKRVE